MIYCYNFVLFQELYRKIRSILNKLTPQKFQTLTQQIIDFDMDTAERLEGVIDLIFEKVGMLEKEAHGGKRFGIFLGEFFKILIFVV